MRRSIGGGIVVDVVIDTLFSYLRLVNRVSYSPPLFTLTVLLRGLRRRFTSTHEAVT
jgi:hypothetical protein